MSAAQICAQAFSWNWGGFFVQIPDGNGGSAYQLHCNWNPAWGQGSGDDVKTNLAGSVCTTSNGNVPSCSQSQAPIALSSPSSASVVNFGGCAYALAGTQVCASAGATNLGCSADFVSCGFPGNPSNAGATQASPGSCTQAVGNNCGCSGGEVNGQINGLFVCVGAAAAGAGGNVTTTAQTPGASTTATDPAGNTTTSNTSSSSSCNGSSCTVTNTTVSTVTNSSGQAGAPATTTTTSTVPQQSFCQQFPNDAQCKGGAAAGGCSVSAIACSGDAVQCYIAQQDHDAACALEQSPPTDNTTANRGGSVLAGTDPDESGLPSASAPATVNVPSSLDQSGHGWDRSGLADLSVVVIGRTVVLPLSRLNSILAVLGAIGIAATAVLCARMVVGSVRAQGA